MSLKQRFSSPSWITLALIWLTIGMLQPWKGMMFKWDSFGYHLYLPAAVIHHDPMVWDLGWVEQDRKEQDASSTLYQISLLPKEKHVIKYPIGLAVIWSPWFMIGHWVAGITGQPQDGYSPPYDQAIRIGMLLYLLLGLLALRRVLLDAFGEWTTAFTLLLLFAATNLIDQATMGMAMPHLPLFCLYAGILWATIRWTADRRMGRAVMLAILMGFAMLIRPSEGLCVLLPLLWRGNDEASFFTRIWRSRWQWAMILLVMFLIGLPQFLYWERATGSWVLDTYNNPGEGFDLGTPYTWPFLFGFRKGWYVYTPLMLIATAGIASLWKQWRAAVLPVLIFMACSIFLLSSWTCWWYADSFGSRAMVGSYAVMALPLAAVLHWATNGSRLRLAGMVSLLSVCALLNIFQYWQFKQGIIDSSRMTWSAYAAGFGQIEKPKNLEALLLVQRSYTGDPGAPDSSRYVRLPMPEMTAKLPRPDTFILDTATNLSHLAYRLDPKHPFTSAVRIPFKELTTQDHAWVESEWHVLMPMAGAKGNFVSLFLHGGQNYAYMAESFEKKEVRSGVWTTLRTYYLTPEVRSKSDTLVCYFWLRDTLPLYVEGPKITVFQPKP